LAEKKCPRCGHLNVDRAVVCFTCNRNLSDPVGVAETDEASNLIEGALRFIQKRGHRTTDFGRVDRLREARTKLLPENVNGEPMTCLRCGAYNLPDAETCSKCNAQLLLLDEDFNIMPRLSARTNVGQVRTNNEDNLAIWALDGVVVGLVADGMGGAAAGEEASRLTVEAVQATFFNPNDENDPQTLSEDILGERVREAILHANRAVMDRAARDASRKGMGTTSTLVLVRSNRAFVGHVGDSRAYLIDSNTNTFEQITSDHSFVQALVASGHITLAQAKYHPMGHVLYRALGQSSDLEVDLYVRTLRAGDRLLLCSDGLTRHLTPEEISSIVLEAESPTIATHELVELTLKRGAEDNVSVVVMMFDGENILQASNGTSY
jgi:PPM family protein phosphatase